MGTTDSGQGASSGDPEAFTGQEPAGRSSPAAAGVSKRPARLVKLTSPLARRLAGRRWFPLWAVLEHRGRRSGRDYAIPVAVLVTPETFVIGLPWGPQTNWVRNVLAAQGCTIRWKGEEFRVRDPQLVGVDVALQAAGSFQRAVIRRFGFAAFLQLRR
jgi:deazaflavin-dependent oxidoreductase (nitroreductase family)